MNLFGVLRHGNINSLSSLLPDFILFYFILIILCGVVAIAFKLIDYVLSILLVAGFVLSTITINIFIRWKVKEKKKKNFGSIFFRRIFVYKSQDSSKNCLLRLRSRSILTLCQLYVDFLRRFRSIHFPFYSDGLYNTTSNILSAIRAVDFELSRFEFSVKKKRINLTTIPFQLAQLWDQLYHHQIIYASFSFSSSLSFCSILNFARSLVLILLRSVTMLRVWDIFPRMEIRSVSNKTLKLIFPTFCLCEWWAYGGCIGHDLKYL